MLTNDLQKITSLEVEDICKVYGLSRCASRLISEEGNFTKIISLFQSTYSLLRPLKDDLDHTLLNEVETFICIFLLVFEEDKFVWKDCCILEALS